MNGHPGRHGKFPRGRNPSNEAEHGECHQIGNGFRASSFSQFKKYAERKGWVCSLMNSSGSFTFIHLSSAISLISKGVWLL